jgi:DNA-binding GntR family transcriptional regulator
MLTEVSLATLFKASRTPVREACIRLVQEGFLRPTSSGRGFAVTEITFDAVREHYQLRLLLEPFAAESAARSTQPEEFFTACAKANEVCVADPQPTFEGYYRRSTAEGEFHFQIARASRNATLAKVVAEVMNQHRRFHYANFTGCPNRELHSTADEHAGILEAIRSHDSDRARSLMFEHIQLGAERSVRTAMGLATGQQPDLDKALSRPVGVLSIP